MAITWSAVSGYMYVGVEAWVKSGPDASGKCVIHADYYLESAGYGHDFTSRWDWWGTGGSGSGQVSFYSPWGGTVRKKISSWDVTVQAYYGQSTNYNFGMSLGPIWNGGNPSVTATVTVPARSYGVPAAPSAVSVSRTSDSQAQVSFTVSSSSSAPVQSVGIERRSASDPTWRNLVWVDTSASGSWTDMTLKANDRYEYRAWTWNTSGYSGYQTAPDAVVSSIAAPTNVRAEKIASGDIVIRWDKAYPGEGVVRIYDNGVRIAEVPSPSGVLEYTHSNPNASVVHTYSLEQVDGGIVSPRSKDSNTVQLLAPPNAPQLLAPSGYVQTGQVTFEWQHNPVDSTVQTEASLRYRAQGAPSWTTRTLTTQNQLAVSLTAGSYEWQVQTKGLHSSYSPWSALGVFQVVDRPGVTIIAPMNGQVYETSELKVDWAFNQNQGAAQTSAEIIVELVGGAEVARRTVSGAAASWTMPGKVLNGASYAVKIRVRSGHGLWSTWATTTIIVSFPAPPAPDASVAWDEATGTHVVTASAVAPIPVTRVLRNLIKNPKGTRLNPNNEPQNWAVWNGVGVQHDGGVRVVADGREETGTHYQYDYVPVSPGQWVGYAVDAECQVPVAGELRFYPSGSDTAVESPRGEFVSNSRAVVVAQCPAGATRVRSVVAIRSGQASLLESNMTGWSKGKDITVTGGVATYSGQSTNDVDRRMISGTQLRGLFGHRIYLNAFITCSGDNGINMGFYLYDRENKYKASLWPSTTKIFFANRNHARIGGEYTLPSVGATVDSSTVEEDDCIQCVIYIGETQPGPEVKVHRVNLVDVDYPGNEALFTYATLLVGDTRASVEELDYFDGDGMNRMINGHSHRVEWEGESDNSVSKATPNGVTTHHLTVERSVDGGTTWEPAADNLPNRSTVVDREGLSYGRTLYRVTAVSNLPSQASTVVEALADSDAMWISGSRGFAEAVPLEWDPKHVTSVGLVNRSVHHFAGRRLGVEMSGIHRQRKVDLSATLLDERYDLVERLEALAYESAPFLYRDPLGRRIYGSLSGVTADRAVGGKWQVSASLEEVGR